MIYINDKKTPHYIYDDLVNIVINHGIQPKRAYIYLASLGIRGEKARIISDSGMDYLPACKVAVLDQKVVTKVTTCKSCKGLSIK